MDQAQTTIVRFRNLRDYGVEFSRPHINTLIREGRFPPAVELSSMAVGWRLSDIQNWLANLPTRRRERGPHSEATREKMKQAWIQRRARRSAERGGGDAA